MRRPTRSKQNILAVYVLSTVLAVSVLQAQDPVWPVKTAPPLPPPSGDTVHVFTVSELNTAVSNLKTGRTIIIHPGDYRLTRSVYIDGVDSVSIRGATGNREDVILRGKGMTNEAGKGSVPHVIATGNADDLLVADLTVADAWYHNMHLAGSRGPQRPHIYNVHFLDCGEQMLKVNPGYNPTAFPDTGIVEYCRFEYTDRAKHWYTNGVDVLDAANWIVRDCEFVRIRGPEGVLAGSAVLFWHTCYNTVVERNFFYECDFGVTYGITAGSSKRAPDSGWDHVGGIIRNNIIFRKESGDVGISVNHAKDYKVYNNTVILNGTFPWNIEYRWSNSSGEIMNNLCDGSIYRRNEAKGDLAGNITNARPSMFLDFDNIDLHLDESGAGAAIDAGVPLDEVIDDWDGHPRDEPDYLDIGADEWNSVPAENGKTCDINGDGSYNIIDVVALLLLAHEDLDDPRVDWNGDGAYTVTDAVALLLDIMNGDCPR